MSLLNFSVYKLLPGRNADYARGQAVLTTWNSSPPYHQLLPYHYFPLDSFSGGPLAGPIDADTTGPLAGAIDGPIAGPTTLLFFSSPPLVFSVFLFPAALTSSSFSCVSSTAVKCPPARHSFSYALSWSKNAGIGSTIGRRR